MDFNESIRAHSDWKMKLQRYLNNPDGSINATELCKDNQCALGKWLYGEGKKYATHSEYQELINEHRQFHKAASEIVIRKDKGENVNAGIALGGNSPYARHSSGVVSLIMKLKTHIH